MYFSAAGNSLSLKKNDWVFISVGVIISASLGLDIAVSKTRSVLAGLNSISQKL